MLTSKLSGWSLLVDIPRDAESTEDDLVDREAMELANLAVLDVLEVGRIVDAAVLWMDAAAGVEWSGEDMSLRSSSSSWSLCSSAESSKGGKEGKEGISLSSISSILLQTREGVSSMAAIVKVVCKPREYIEKASETEKGSINLQVTSRGGHMIAYGIKSTYFNSARPIVASTP